MICCRSFYTFSWLLLLVSLSFFLCSSCRGRVTSFTEWWSSVCSVTGVTSNTRVCTASVCTGRWPTHEPHRARKYVRDVCLRLPRPLVLPCFMDCFKLIAGVFTHTSRCTLGFEWIYKWSVCKENQKSSQCYVLASHSSGIFVLRVWRACHKIIFGCFNYCRCLSCVSCSVSSFSGQFNSNFIYKADSMCFTADIYNTVRTNNQSLTASAEA